MVARRPNLFVIGAMKSGTSSLHMYLNSHPSVFMSTPKEPDYFVYDDIEQTRIDSYLRLFNRATSEAYLGESSTSYSKLPLFHGVPERIARFNPDSRLIYIMRDPIKRVLSHYRFAVRKSDEQRDLVTAVRESDHFINCSHYAMQLQPYLELFGSEQLYTLTLEELARDTPAIMTDLHQWLGIDTSHSSQIYAHRTYVTPASYLQFKRSGILFTALRSTTWRNWGRRYIPARLRQHAKGVFSHSLVLDERDVSQAIDYLRPIQREQTRELRVLLGRDFPEWTTLYGP